MSACVQLCCTKPLPCRMLMCFAEAIAPQQLLICGLMSLLASCHSCSDSGAPSNSGLLVNCYQNVGHLGSCGRLSSYLGFRRTRITESPLMKSLGMKRSLLTGVEPFLPLPVLGICSNDTQIQSSNAAAIAAHVALPSLPAATSTKGSRTEAITAIWLRSLPLSTSPSHSLRSCCSACQTLLPCPKAFGYFCN